MRISLESYRVLFFFGVLDECKYIITCLRNTVIINPENILNIKKLIEALKIFNEKKLKILVMKNSFYWIPVHNSFRCWRYWNYFKNLIISNLGQKRYLVNIWLNSVSYSYKSKILHLESRYRGKNYINRSHS